jgi:hypothetical protein
MAARAAGFVIVSSSQVEMPEPHLTSPFATTAASDELLLRLFGRHFDDPVAALFRLDKCLRTISLSFDLRAQLRELEYPPQPGLPKGVPSFIYYYVPNSGWGSDKPVPADPLHSSFVYATDGIDLNMGCPVRLVRAFDFFARLPEKDQEEVKEGLGSATKHLATVEELLWLSAWKSPSDLGRGGALPGAKGNVDWALKSGGFPLYLEAKFRPSDWPRLTDQGTFVPMGGSFLGKAAHKFPNPPHEAALYIVGITAFDNLTSDLVRRLGQELEANPQIHGVVFRSLTHMTHVLSLERGLLDKVFNLLATPAARDFPTNYSVASQIQQCNERVTQRAEQNSNSSDKVFSRVLCRGLQPRLDEPVPILDDAYRATITSRGANGEPHFQLIPKYLYPQKNTSLSSS